ncbi:MAG: cytochrome c nitrite reductase small subunit [Desulfovibrionales bacterium]
MTKSRLRWRYALIGFLLLAAVGAFVMLGPPGLLARTETPEFCSSCHVMQSQYEAWFHEGAHRSAQCVDCHLPHDNVFMYYLWKSIDGMRDIIVFHSGTVPETIEISDHGQEVLQGNCVRCHETTVWRIDKERNCWDCHRRLSHLRSGAILTN